MKGQNNIYDRIIALCGVVLALVPIADWSGMFNAANVSLALNISSLCVGLLLVTVIIVRLRNKSYSIVTDLASTEFYDGLQEALTESSSVMVFGPDKSLKGKEFIEYCCEQGIGISILGSSEQINMLIASVEDVAAIHDLLSVTCSSNGFTLVAVCDRPHRTVTLGSLRGRRGMIIRLKGAKVETEIQKLLEKEVVSASQPIRLSQIANPGAFLDVVNQTNRRYLDNFADLKSGFISFYGTEVLNVQSGWLESGRFKRIRTLDLTSNPGLLLTRDRYLRANKTFISNPANSIERVFLIERRRLADETFRQSLQTVALMQTDMGIGIDIQFLEDLSDEQKQDFILYDDFSVLVEEKQANSDYSFGKSTAYFSRKRIKAYEEIFNAVWKKAKTREQIIRFLEQSACVK